MQISSIVDVGRLKLNTIIYMEEINFKTEDGIVDLHPTKGTHWVAYIIESYFGSYSCPPSNLITDFIIKRNELNGKCVLSKYKIQGMDSYSSYIVYQ